MKLYDADFAPNPRRVRIFLAEKGISIPHVPVDLRTLEHKGEAFRSLNPQCQVPALELDDGTVICESTAICRYFEAVQPEPNLFGHDALEQAQVEMWTRRIEFGLYAAVAAVLRHLHPGMAQVEVPQVGEWGEANKPKVQAALEFLDAQLAERAFIAGARFSYADIVAITTIDFMKMARVDMPDKLEHLARWRAVVSARPSMSA
ncbi:glutathione S-transferase family protein [Xanthobacter sp. TB0139]|uniref:glutathione S-transferase family protein n=1 Tax=Xanthobacter sp. TB0139 TaxID=3459178 RepID=UPI004039B807